MIPMMDQKEYIYIYSSNPEIMGNRVAQPITVPNLAGEFFPLPRGFVFLICSVFRPLHLSCRFPSMLHAIGSILELEPVI